MKDFHFTLSDLADGEGTRTDFHRSQDFKIIFVHESSANLLSDLTQFPLTENHLYFISPGQVFHLDGSIKGYLLSFGGEWVEDMNKYIPPLFSLHNPQPFVALTSAEDDDIQALFTLMEKEEQRFPKDIALLRSLLQTLLIYCVRIKSGVVKKGFTWRQTRMAKIEILIETYYRQEHAALFYAKTLDLTPQYLNRLLKTSLGKTLTELINERIILEAKRELIHTTRTINEIAEGLGFYDPSYFTKFFKRHESLTPMLFREKFRYYH